MKILNTTLVCIIMLSFFLGACRKESFIESADAKVNFSLDTLCFDTVFTSVGSATRFFKIKNPHNQSIRISKIYLEKGVNSYFNLNIDGVSGDAQERIEIPAKDSIYVFAEVTINPDDQNNPFVINENVIIETNGNVQKVVLEAWGQNANYIPNNLSKGKQVVMTSDQTWDDPKPYVIYGALEIRGCKLTIPAGTRIHIHGGIVKTTTNSIYNDGLIFVTNGGQIITQGTREKPVIIQGDRLEKEFENIPAQWNLIYFAPSTQGTFNYTTIKNARLGLYADSTSTLKIRYSQIFNTAGPAIFARQANISLENTLIHSTGDRSLVFNQGGTYNILYSTVASFGSNSPALEISNAFCRAYSANGDCASLGVAPLSLVCRNSILNSSQLDAFSFIEVKGVPFNYYFENCIYKVNDLVKQEKGGYIDFYNYTKDCINFKNGDKLFKKIDTDNYRLDTLSIAEKKAIPLNGFNEDLDGTMRDAQTPDIGAYEFKPR